MSETPAITISRAEHEENKAKILRLVGQRTQAAEAAYEAGLPALPQWMGPGQISEQANQKVDWAVDGLWTSDAQILLAAQEKSGKTFLVCAMAIAIASGHPFLGCMPVLNPGPVAIIAGEGSIADIPRRLLRMCRGIGIPLTDLPIHMLYAPSLKLNRRRDMLHIWNEVERLGARLVLIDPLARLMEGNENSKEVMAGILNPLISLSEKKRCAVCVAHHLRKKTIDATEASERVRGSSDLSSWYSTALFLTGRPSQSNKINVEILQRIRGENIPSSFLVHFKENDGMDGEALRLLAQFPEKNSRRRHGDEDVERAYDLVLDLLQERGQKGLIPSEIMLHTQMPKPVLSVAIKRMIMEDKLAFWQKTEELSEKWMLMPTEQMPKGVPTF